MGVAEKMGSDLDGGRASGKRYARGERVKLTLIHTQQPWKERVNN